MDVIARSVETWSKLNRKYGFNQVLTPAGWALNLPVALHGLESSEHVLYQVP